MSKPIYGDIQAAEKAFERMWFENGGSRLPESDKRLAMKAYCLGWVDSEFRFMEHERKQPA